MESPYIVGYFDSFIDGQKINIVLEYCMVGDLNSLVEKQKILEKPLIENIIWKIFIHLCLGLQYLHSKNIVHRDLKSLNVFMLKDHIAKIGDLGCVMYVKPEKEEVPQKAAEVKETEHISPTNDIDFAPDAGQLGLKNQMSMESNPFDCMEDDLTQLVSADLDGFLGNEDQGRSASFISPSVNNKYE